jgi:hypothetical protein
MKTENLICLLNTQNKIKLSFPINSSFVDESCKSIYAEYDSEKKKVTIIDGGYLIQVLSVEDKCII